jgi:two-component system sensor histidine kinase DegS
LDTEPTTLLTRAYDVVAQMLNQLRTLVETAQHDANAMQQQLRQQHRVLDEVTARHQFARAQGLPTADELGARTRQARADMQQVETAAQTAQRTLKQLDQLVRQIEMSSSSLNDDADHAAADPWVLALRSQVILGREEERVRLAREVHDGPAQVLANSLMLTEQSRDLLHDRRLEPLGLALDRLSASTREGLHEVRRFIADLRPGQLDELGLVGALHDYIRRYRETYHTAVTFEAVPLPRLSTEAEIGLYRIVQEALQNVHKHAPDAAVSVTFAVQQPDVLLTIRDTGPGFDPREVARRAGRESWGLTSMHERAEMIGARLTVHSQPGQGTEIAVVMPVR